jgi:hypothetical protein
MATTKKTPLENIVVFGLVGAIILFAVLHFLFNKTGGVSGLQALGLQGAGYWIGVVIGTLVAAGIVIYVIMGNRNATLKPGPALILLIIAVVIFFSMFTRACNTKADPIVPVKTSAIK